MANYCLARRFSFLADMNWRAKLYYSQCFWQIVTCQSFTSPTGNKQLVESEPVGACIAGNKYNPLTSTPMFSEINWLTGMYLV